jgi:glycosyltransferase involved in cell wall biosynthesis
MKVSIITAVYNSEQYVKSCIESVVGQDYPNIEYIVIDGGSTDGTIDIIKEFDRHIQYFTSEKDKGIYDALNKGIAAATGDVVGILHADDILASSAVISQIVSAFESLKADAVYGHLNYVHRDEIHKVQRKWIAKPYDLNSLRMGWMPAHPTLYIKRELFEKFGNYSLNFGTAADYELILRFLFKHKIKAVCLPILMVNMRAGGVSNANFKQRYLALVNDYRALKTNGIPFAIITLLFKKVTKFSQFIT